MRISTQNGFIALLSVIIISFTLLLLTVSLNLSSILGRFNILDSEIKQQSAEAADACVEIARLALATDNYELDEVKDVTVDQSSITSCQFKILSTSSAEVCSSVYDSYTFYDVSFDDTDDLLPITSFTEVPPSPADLSTNGTCLF